MPQGSATGLSERTAIQRRSQNARHGGLSDAAMAAEDVAVGGASLFEAFCRVRVTCSCPMTSENFCGRYLRARTV